MKVKKDTIVRTAVLGLALTNQILSATGHNMIPLSDEQVTEFITVGFTVVTSLWAWWKNNSFTQKALKADSFLNVMRKYDGKEDLTDKNN